MARDILGNTIEVGEFLIWMQASKIIPLYCRTDTTYGTINSYFGARLKIGGLSNAGKYVKVFRGQMREFLSRSALSENLFEGPSRAHTVLPHARIAARRRRRAAADAFLSRFVEISVPSLSVPGPRIPSLNSSLDPQPQEMMVQPLSNQSLDSILTTSENIIAHRPDLNDLISPAGPAQAGGPGERRRAAVRRHAISQIEYNSIGGEVVKVPTIDNKINKKSSDSPIDLDFD